MFDLERFLEESIRISSNKNVDEMRESLVETLENNGAEAEVDEAGNVISSRGTGSPHTVLNTHLDTISPHIPFSRDGDIIRGRGSCDAKGSLTAMVDAFLNHSSNEGTVTLAVTPDEESLSMGADALSLDADQYIVGEPTGLDVCNSSKGRFQGTIQVQGRSAHAANPEKGTNTIESVCQVTEALNTFDSRRDTPDTHPDLGQPTLTPTTINGGDATNQIPGTCEITVDRRSVPPESSKEFEEKLTDHLRTYLSDEYEVDFSLTSRKTPFLEAFETSEDTQLVEALQNASDGELRPFPAVAESSYFAKKAPTVIFGPGQLEDEEGPIAHSEREYISVSEVSIAAEILRKTLSQLHSGSETIEKIKPTD